MGNTSVQQPQQTPVTSTPAVTGTQTTATPNDQAAQAATIDRRRKAATGMPQPWALALGGLLPADAAGPAPNVTLKAPPLPEFRLATYRLLVTDSAGIKQAQDYLAAANADENYQNALREVVRNADTDKPGIAQIKMSIALLTHSLGFGDINVAGLRILTTLALTTEDGKAWLKADGGTVAQPLLAYAEQKYPASATDDTSKSSREALIGLAQAIRNPHSAEPGAVATVKPEPLNATQQAAADKLIKDIQTQFPADKAVPVNADESKVGAMKASPAEMKKLLAAINAADPRVKEHVYAWRDKATGKGVLALLGSHLSPSQVEEVVSILDPVEQLHKDLQDLRNGRRDPKLPKVTEYDLLHGFLAGHLGDQATRHRVRDHAVIMQAYVTFQPDAQRRVLMRMIVTGREQPDAVDKLHAAAEAGDSHAAVSAIFELGQTPAKLAELRSDLIFVHRLRDKCNDRVKWNGVEVKAYDLFLKMNGVDPHETKEAGAPDKQSAVDPNAPPKPGEQPRVFKPEDRAALDNRLYNPYASKLADELNSWYTKDSKVMGWLYEFQQRCAEPEMVELLRLAKEAPGVELANRIQKCGCDVRLRVQKGLSDNNLVQAERILGFVKDQATVGVIGGQGTLATDGKVESGKGVVPLDQAIRETRLKDGRVVSAVIHEKAQEMADALGAWFYTADKVRTVWRNYNAVINAEVCADLRVKTGLERVWPIEMLANAFVQVGGGTLQSKLQSELGKKHNDVITEMGMQPSDVDARRELAEQKVKLDNTGNESANDAALAGAKAQVEQAAKLEAFKAPAKDLFDSLSKLSKAAPNEVLEQVGGKYHAGVKMEKVAAVAAADVTAGPKPAPVAEHGAGTNPKAAQPSGEAAQPTDFVSFYRKEFGIDPMRHLVEVAKAVATKERSAKQVGDLFKIADPALYVAAPPPAEEVKVDENNITLVAPGFDEKEAKRRAQKMWDLMHTNGQIQLIRAEIEGRTEEEVRLIQAAFRQLSGGIELSFYMQQHAAQGEAKARAMLNGDETKIPVSIGGDARGLKLIGDKAETEAAIEVAQKGRVTLEKRITTAIAGNNMDEVYTAVETASADERRALLANDTVMNQLRKFGDDSYEWNRIYKSLTGQSDLFDRMESRAHGRHGFMGAFEGTDEKGMTADVKAYARQRKVAITKEVLAAHKPPRTKPGEGDAEKIEARFKAEFQSIFENPSIQAILKDELSGTELSTVEGQVQGAGEDNKLASALTEGDWSEDEEKILADIKAMSPAERKAARENPEYMNLLRKAIQTQATWRDAMIALSSDEDGSKGENDDNYSVLERASRSFKQDNSEMLFEEKDVIQALSKLSDSEYQRLMKDERLQVQILNSLDGHPDLLAMARQMMGYNPANAAQATGLTVGEAPDPEKGVYKKEQVERLAFLKHSAISRVRAGSSRSWAMLLEASIAIYNMKLKPSDGGDDEAGGPPAAGAKKDAAPAPAQDPKAAAQNGKPQQQSQAGPPQLDPKAADQPKAPPKDHEGDVDKRLRAEILGETKALFTAATAGWGSQTSTDSTQQKIDIDAKKQQEIVEQAILHQADPSSSLLLASTGLFGDDEDRIKDTLKKASDEQLIGQYTTVVQKAPNGTESMADKYQDWKKHRQAADAAAKQAGADGQGETPKRKPKVGSDEWKARTAFRAHVIDTSAMFEDLLIKYTGGLFADDNKMEKGSTRVRDNSEWLEWRTIIRERIPGLDRKKIATALGTTGDTEAMEIVNDPTLTNTLSRLAYDEERYAVDRGEGSNYNMDRVTAGGEGQALDTSMGDYRREVLTSVTAKGDKADDYGNITADEQARITEAKERFNQNTSAFREAKSAVATVASTVVALIITAVVTILTAGTATGPVAVMLLGALTAGAASAGTQLTKEAIQGTDFDLGKEGLQAIARDTVMGAVAAGTSWYAGRLASGLWNTTTAAQQAALIGKAAADPSFLVQLGRGMTENALQTGMQGLFESGVAAFDPALWLDGWREGWTRGSAAARERAGEIPGEMVRAAIIAAISHSAGAGMNKLRGEKGGDDPHNPLRHKKLGNRMNIAERTQLVGKQMYEGIGEGIIEGGAEIVLDERTYRAEGQKPGEMLKTMAGSVTSSMQENASNVHAGDAAGYQRHKAGEAQLSKFGHQLNETEKALYAQLVTTQGQDNDPTVLSVAEFKAAREGMINEAVAKAEAEHDTKLDAETKTKFETHARTAPTLDEFRARVAGGPEVKGKPGGTPVLPDFKQQGVRDAERQRAKEIEQQLAAATSNAAPHHATYVEVAPEHAALMAQANKLVAELAKANAPGLVDLVTRVNQVSSELKNALMTVGGTATSLVVVHAELKAQLAAIDASPNDATKYAALHALIVTAQMQTTLGPKAVEAAAAGLKSKVAELKTLVDEVKQVHEAQIRKAANSDGALNAPPSQTTNQPPPAPVHDTKPVVTADPAQATKPKTDPGVVDHTQQPGDPAKAIDPAKQPGALDPAQQGGDPAKAIDPAKQGDPATDVEPGQTKVDPLVAKTAASKYEAENAKKLKPEDKAELERLIRMHGIDEGKRLFDKQLELRAKGTGGDLPPPPPPDGGEGDGGDDGRKKVDRLEDMQGASEAVGNFQGQARAKATTSEERSQNKAIVEAEIRRVLPYIRQQYPNGEAEILGPNQIKINLGKSIAADGQVTFKGSLVIEIQTTAPTDSVASFSFLTSEAGVIRVSEGARDKHVERAIADLVTEMKATREAQLGGTKLAKESALRPGSKSTELDGNDLGNIAQLNVLLRQLDAAKHPIRDGENANPVVIRQLNNDITALLDALGLTGHPEDARFHELVRPRLGKQARQLFDDRHLPPRERANRVGVDANKDGVTDAARVGVAGMEVPDKIPRLDNLPPEQAAAEKRFAEAYEQPGGKEKLAQEYMDFVASDTRIDDKTGAEKKANDVERKTFSTDEAKGLSPDYNTEGVEGASRDDIKAARGKMNLAVHQTANAVAKLAFQMRLEQIQLEGGGMILITAGGVGAGKGYALEKNPIAGEMAQRAKVIWDTAGEQNSTELPWVIAEAKKRGLTVEILYVHQKPENSWENLERGVIDRAKKGGRMVDARLHADSYAEGARNFDATKKQFADVKTVIVDVTGSKPEIIDNLPKEALTLDADTVYQRNVEFLKKQENLPDYVKVGGSELGEKVWGEPRHRQAIEQLGKIDVSHLPAGTKVEGDSAALDRDTYYLSQADGKKMLELLLELGPDVSTRMWKKGFIVRRHTDGTVHEWYFEFNDHAGKMGAKPADGARTGGLPPPNAATIEIWGFSGVRKIKDRPEFTDPKRKTGEQWTEKEQAMVARAKEKDTLLYAGHVGISLDGGKTIWGFTPGNLPDAPIAEIIKSLMAHDAYPGVVKDDTDIFVRAAQMAREHGWDTQPFSAVQLVDKPKQLEVVTEVAKMAGMKPGEHGLGYSFPLQKSETSENGEHYKDSNGFAGECVRNCAAFPEKVGVKIPEASGNIKQYLPELQKWADEDGPKDERKKTDEAKPKDTQ